MSYLLDDIMVFESMLDEEEATLKELEMAKEPLDVELDDHEGQEDLETAFAVMKELMARFKNLCDYCEYAWKIQEIPAPLRQRLITLDQHNQDKYQKMYVMIQKYADQMKQAHIREPQQALDMDEL